MCWTWKARRIDEPEGAAPIYSFAGGLPAPVAAVSRDRSPP